MIGAAVAAGAGLLGSALNYASQREAARKEAKAKQEYRQFANEQVDDYSANANKNLNAYYNGLGNAGNSLQSAMDSYSNDLDTASSLNFNKGDYSVDKYYNPARQQLINQVAEKASGTAAANGMGRSSDAIMGVASAVADKNEELYRNALSDMQNERSFDLNLAQDERNARINTLKEKLGLAQTSYNMQKDVLNKYNDQNSLMGALAQMKLDSYANTI